MAETFQTSLKNVVNQKPEGIAAINKKYSVAISAQCRFQRCSELFGALSQSSKAFTKNDSVGSQVSVEVVLCFNLQNAK